MAWCDCAKCGTEFYDNGGTDYCPKCRTKKTTEPPEEDKTVIR